MELLLIPVPVFDAEFTVHSYLFRYKIMNPSPHADPCFSPLLEILQKTGDIDAFTGGNPLFVPVNSAVLLAEPERQCRQLPRKVILLLEDKFPDDEEYWEALNALRRLGFSFSVKISQQPQATPNLLSNVDYLVWDLPIGANVAIREALAALKRENKRLRIVRCGLDTPKNYQKAIQDKFDLFEGPFYYTPLTGSAESTLSPLKANLIHLLNVVRDENFEFSTIAEIVQRDPALTYSLMRLVNSPFLGLRHKIRSIRHAVTMLGQDEVRKWVTAAVFRSLGTDSPSESVRLSLIRAKYAENLASCFQMESVSQSLFLMGLFSVLDSVLQTSIREALDTISVSDEIRDALIEHRGPYYKVLELIDNYEHAAWDEVAAFMEEHHLNAADITHAYTQAISWYNELISDRVRPARRR